MKIELVKFPKRTSYRFVYLPQTKVAYNAETPLSHLQYL